MTWEIYLLSIMDGLGVGVGILGGLSGTIGFVCCLVGALFVLSPIDEEDTPRFRLLLKAGIGMCVVATFCLLVSMAIPTKRDIIEAYIMVEGSKVANAENVEDAAKNVSDKLDKLIDAIGDKKGDK